jgi:SAM-dependent methyltransferase
VSDNPTFDESSASAGAIRRLVEMADPRAARASLAVHPDDDMFAFSVGATGSAALGAMAYFRAGISIDDTINQIIDWRFDGADRVRSFLDFAAGYGRSTRFLVEHVPAERICVGEIQPDSLTFQATQFGVRTMQSTTDPAQLDVAECFDVVFISSLFTHLPGHTFGRWLAKLWEFVAPGGVIIFSVHDEALNDTGVELTDGFAFIPSTEVAALSTDDYGTNFTTEAFVRSKIGAAIGADHAASAIRLPRALCFMQDVWVVCNGAPPAKPIAYESGPSGAVDQLALSGKSLTAIGWAADTGFCTGDRSSHRIAEVLLYLNGSRIGRAVPRDERPDVGPHLGKPDDPLIQNSGWTASVRRRGGLRRVRIQEGDVVTVVARCEYGRRFVLDSACVSESLEPAATVSWLRRQRRRLGTARRIGREGGLRGVLGHSLVVAGRAVERLGGRLAAKG